MYGRCGTKHQSDLLCRHPLRLHKRRQEWRGGPESCIQKSEEQEERSNGCKAGLHRFARRARARFLFAKWASSPARRFGNALIACSGSYILGWAFMC